MFGKILRLEMVDIRVVMQNVIALSNFLEMVTTQTQDDRKNLPTEALMQMLLNLSKIDDQLVLIFLSIRWSVVQNDDKYCKLA